uniref:Uncharacterized protein n=1 Tax=Gasterosteus aculeatus aculeatus TaxID=481459 RepID=A0AAQ4QYU7_GASAC
MLKADERKEQLNTMSEEERRAEEQRYVEMRKKHGEHPKVNHPFKGSEDQLKEVWQESDGLDLDNFDPKTFLKIHGVPPWPDARG